MAENTTEIALTRTRYRAYLQYLSIRMYIVVKQHLPKIYENVCEAVHMVTRH